MVLRLVAPQFVTPDCIALESHPNGILKLTAGEIELEECKISSFQDEMRDTEISNNDPSTSTEFRVTNTIFDCLLSLDSV